MSPIRIGFVGFGQVASTLSQPMAERGAQVTAYDILLQRSEGRAILQERSRAQAIQFCALEKVATNADYVLSTVTTQVAREVARACLPYLGPGQVYLDLNSTAPSVKVELSQIVGPSGADFVEGAILGAVGSSGIRTRILVGGRRGRAAAETLTRLGLNASQYSPEIGKASTFKLLRSVFSKGMEALLIEFLIAGKKAGIQDELWEEITGLLHRDQFERVASNWVCTHATAYERRYHEMVQVADTMREIGVEPIMTTGTRAFFKRSLSLGLGDAFLGKPETIEQAIDIMAEYLKE